MFVKKHKKIKKKQIKIEMKYYTETDQVQNQNRYSQKLHD